MAAHHRTIAKICRSLDDSFVGATQNILQLSLDPTVGKHLITLVDENGNSITMQFEILEKERWEYWS